MTSFCFILAAGGLTPFGCRVVVVSGQGRSIRWKSPAELLTAAALVVVVATAAQMITASDTDANVRCSVGDGGKVFRFAALGLNRRVQSTALSNVSCRGADGELSQGRQRATHRKPSTLRGCAKLISSASRQTQASCGITRPKQKQANATQRSRSVTSSKSRGMRNAAQVLGSRRRAREGRRPPSNRWLPRHLIVAKVNKREGWQRRPVGCAWRQPLSDRGTGPGSCGPRLKTRGPDTPVLQTRRSRDLVRCQKGAHHVIGPGQQKCWRPRSTPDTRTEVD